MAGTLWTPDRDIPLHTRSVQHMSPVEMKVFEDLHAIAFRLNIEVRCGKCGTPFQGLNDGHARTQSIFCGCREIRAEVRGVIRPQM